MPNAKKSSPDTPTAVEPAPRDLLTIDEFMERAEKMLVLFRAEITQEQLMALYEALCRERFDGPLYREACTWIERRKRSFPLLADFIEAAEADDLYG